VGTGVEGSVVLSTATFKATTNDPNCYTAGALVASSCTIANSSVDGSSTIVVGFSANGQVATLPNPTITTAGRLVYITAANGSKDFTLSVNGGGTGNEIAMRQNTTATMLWNGTFWTAAGASSSTTLQAAYDNTLQSAGGAELVVSHTANTNGLTIRDSAVNPVNGTLLSVQSASAATLLSVNDSVTEYSTDGGAETAGAGANNFPSGTWAAVGSAAVTRHTTVGNFIATGQGSVKVVTTTAANDGTADTLSDVLTTNMHYNVSFAARLDSGTFTDLNVYYSVNGTTASVACATNKAVTTSVWTKINCAFTAPASGITASNAILIRQTNSGTARTFYVDTFSMTLTTNTAPNIQIGGGVNGGPVALLTLDRAASAPIASNNDVMLGSMYYDTTLGKLQCYEADGWGACGSSPDDVVTISPEYTNAVMHGTGVGTMTSDICSDTLNINDGSSGQATICGTNETYNFYKWTSPQASAQTYSIYVTYQLPSTFKTFASGQTSIMGRTVSTNATVAYGIYRNSSASGLTQCGPNITVSTGVAPSWKTGTAIGATDPSTCGFAPGDTIVFKIDVTASSNADAYVGNLNFTFSNK